MDRRKLSTFWSCSLIMYKCSTSSSSHRWSRSKDGSFVLTVVCNRCGEGESQRPLRGSPPRSACSWNRKLRHASNLGSRCVFVFVCDRGVEEDLQHDDPVHWLCTNVRHILHHIDDLGTKVTVLSSQSSATDGSKETLSVLILRIGYVQMFDIFFIA